MKNISDAYILELDVLVLFANMKENERKRIFL